jgi:hypothetical protein
MTTKDGGPAFSGLELRDTKFTVQDLDGTVHEESAGYKSLQHVAGNLTVRDWFAGMALGHIPKLLEVNDRNLTTVNIAEWAYEIADAMLAAREATR